MLKKHFILKINNFIDKKIYTKDAFNLILQFKAPETGQLFLASSANLINFCSFIFETFPFKFKSIEIILPSSKDKKASVFNS